MEDINRIKLVLVEKKRTSKWLSGQLGVTPSTVSKWCTNSSQPDLSNLLKIAELLEVDIKELLVSEYKKNYLIHHDVNKEISQGIWNRICMYFSEFWDTIEKIKNINIFEKYIDIDKLELFFKELNIYKKPSIQK